MNRNTLLPIVFLALMSPNVLANTYNSNPNPNSNSANSSTTNNDSQYNNAQNRSGRSQKEYRNAIDVILEDHAQIKKMMAQLNKSLGKDMNQSRTIFRELKDFLIKHETMEQKVWYPELEKYENLKDIINNLKKEEKTAADELQKIDAIQDDKEWTSNIKKLMKDVEHHANDEEKKLFPKVKKSLSKSLLDQLGDKLREYKTQNQ